MALQIADRVKETTSTTGTGALLLSGAMVGFRAFSSVCSNGDTCYYALQGVNVSGVLNGDWEVGLGTYSASANTLTRTTVLSSSNANAVVALQATGTQVWMDLPAGAVFGIAQTRQDVTGSRAVGTTYTNTTNRPILVVIAMTSTETSTSDLVLTGVDMYNVTSTTTGFVALAMGMIPIGGTYSITGSSAITLNAWTEFR